MNFLFHYEKNQESLSQHEKWKGQDCMVLLKTAAANYCLRAYVDDAATDTVTLSFIGTVPEDIQECIEDATLIIEDQNVRLNQYESHINDSFAGSRELVFPDEMADVSWNISYELGTGVDAITNMVKNKAVTVKPVSENPSDTLKTKIYADLIKTASDISTLFSTTLTGNITVANLDFNGSFQYLKSLKCSETASTIVLVADYVEAVYPGGYEYQLTDQARALLKDSKAFRERYGDYYVADIRRGGYFIVVHGCEANSIESLNSFHAGLSMGKEELGQFTTSSAFKKLVADNNIRLTTQIFCYGSDEFPASYLNGDVEKALDWFNQHRKPVPYYVKLKHYSSLANGNDLSKKIDYSSDDLQKVKEVYSRFWKLYGDVQTIHKNYKEPIHEKFLPLFDDVTMRLADITGDAEYRGQLLKRILDLQKKVTSILIGYNKYKALKVMKALEPQPGEDHKQKTDTKTQIQWDYGFADYPEAKTKTFYVKERGNGFKCKTYLIHENYPNETIVGYKIISNWIDGTNGDWWKLTDFGLLDQKLDIRIDSYYGRGYDWKVIIYVVDNKDIHFHD